MNTKLLPFLDTYFKKCLLIILSLCLISCGNSEESATNSALLASQYTINGTAAKGALINASVNVYEMDQTGMVINSEPTFQTTTNGSGQFLITLNSFEQPLLIKTSGGKYIDESDQEPDINLKRVINFTQEQGLSSVINPGDSTAAVTILTSALLQKSLNETHGNAFFATLNNNRDNAQQVFGFDIFSTQPADTISPDEASSEQAKQYALLLGGFANIVNRSGLELGFSVPNFDIVDAIITDFSDGMLDGKLNNNFISKQNSNDITTNIPSNINLNDEINRFKNNNFTSFSQTSLIEIDENTLSQDHADNKMPSIDAGIDIIVKESEAIQIKATASDSDGSIVLIQWEQISGPELILSDSLEFSMTAPEVTQTTSAVLQVTVTDNRGAINQDQINITIEDVAINQNPTANAGQDQQVNEAQVISLSGQASDSDGTIVGFNWQQTSGPNVSILDNDKATASFTAPNVLSITELIFNFTVTDNSGGQASDQVSIFVSPVNQPPNVNAGADQSVSENTQVTITGSALDTDGSITTLIWTQTFGPNVVINNANTLTMNFTAPSVSQATTFTFSLSATDNENATSSDSINIIVNPQGNLAPTANAGIDQAVDSGTSVNLTGSGSDSDGTIISYLWLQTSGTSVSLINANTANAHFVAPNVSSTEILVFSLTVTDNSAATGVDTVSITINPINQAPTANAGIDQTVDSAATVDLIGTGSDTDGTIISYLWTQTSGTAVSLNNANTANASFTAPTVTSTEILIFSLTVTDNNDAVGIDSISITVQSANQAPTVNAGIDQNVTSNSNITLSGSASDSDGSIISHLWKQTAGTSVSLNNATSLSATFTAPILSTTEVLTFSLTVTDNLDATASDLINVTVTPLQSGTLLWSFQTSGPVLSSPALDVSGNILIGSDDLNLYSISPTGIKNWNFTATGFVRSSPMYTNTGNIYVGSSDNKLYAIDSSGNLIWNFPTANAIISSPTLLPSGNIFISSVNIIHSVTTQGSEAWQFTIPTGETSSGAISKAGTLFLGSGDNFIYGFDQPAVHPPKWEFQIGTPVHGAPAIGSDGAIFIGADDNKVYAFELNSDGTNTLIQRWVFTTSAKVKATPALGANNVLYVGSEDNNFYAIDMTTGSSVWSFPTLASVVSSAAIASDGTIIFGSGDGNVYALNPDGTLKWKFQTGALISSSPVISPNGTVFIGSADGKVYAIFDNNGGLSTTAPWPMFRFNSTHTGNIN
ncbi:PQQ-binding-like beta-propeller repeat protein [Pseudoalteromonas denitrificans]|uniref:Outer membrane protein assembly factor BamB, contains PQQ-like beta-propeller repeat n=1 Tax=Pseudoalteromonas denitrificans DSM 6059 TaxID=1123010 RepID=A0A1I1FKG5_9GAMM|nr:PQQ-binding-like beta-propeller repeat protein [Pseudoalteromonas denitrificans]SFB99476.1 Outer membrane protein assembly factor BamB, contains PQQ-like beta-propeller repeat [Pseudoalteromonas denitrificans DSM 6059]